MASSSSATLTNTQQRVSSAGDRAIHQDVPKTENEVVMTYEVKLARNREHKKMVNQYEFTHRLGRGQHGEVFVAIDTVSKQKVAIKAVKRKNPKLDRMSMLRKRNLPTSPHLPLTDKLGTTEQKIKKEIAIMKKCRHPHVVKLLEVIDDELNEKIYMVMEFLGGGEIKWRTEQEEPILRVAQTRRICRDIILGLEYLHHNGIIHRDIKPANLLWSDDRRMVKIADFGVSHFSYAQRVQAVGQGKAELPEEDILMNEADLYKFAGTPMFLAPEILYDTGSSEASQAGSTASNLNTLGTSTPGDAATPRKKPEITKAIDIWALGVTMYALLFATLPFSGEAEWMIYKKIKDEDWDVRETMGLDRVPVGGRHQPKPKKGEETEGYMAVDLLQRFLEKDPRKRITIEEVKRHAWLTKDMPSRDLWIRQTAISKSSLAVTEDETSSAVSSVKFRWPGRVARGLFSLIRNVRSQRSLRRPPPPPSGTALNEDAYSRVGTRSMPNVELVRQRSIAIGAHEREKTKQRTRTTHPRNKSSVDIRSQTGTWRSSSASSGYGVVSGQPPSPSSAVDGSGSKPRRGSAPSSHIGLETLQIPSSRHASSSSRVSSPQPTPTLSNSVSSTPVQTAPTSRSTSQEGHHATSDRPRSRISMITKFWKPGSSRVGLTSEASTSTLPSGSTSPMSPVTPPGVESLHYIQPHAPRRDLSARRSEDAFRSRHNNPAFSIAMRAASWGEVGEYSRPSDDRTSIYSGERQEDALDAETFLVGAGGVAQSPVPSLPSGVLSTVSSTVSLGPPVLSAAQALLQRVESAEPPMVLDPASQDMQQQRQFRSHAASPLAQSLYNGSRDALSRSSSTFERFESSSSSSSETPSDTEHVPGTSQIYQEEDEESESEENAPLEVRTRRPSWGVNDRPSTDQVSSRTSDISREGCARPTIRC